MKKKRGFCKYHNFLGHKTSQCYLFRDLIQSAIKEGRLKFGEKPKNLMKVDTDPLHIAETNFVEPVDINMVDVVKIEGGQLDDDKVSEDIQGLEVIEGLRVRFEELEIAEGPKFKVNMVDLNQLSPEMGEIERRLKMENDRI